MRLIDLHCDTIWACMRKEEHLYSNTGHIDLDKLKTAESMAQFFACFIHMDNFQGEHRFTKAYDYALEMIAFAKKEFRNVPEHILLARSRYDVEKNDENGQISAFLTIEEGGIVDSDMERLHRLYEEGVRLMTLTWNYENCIGYPNSRDAEIMNRGLKPFGMDVVEEMNRLGMLIDVSHLSDGGFWDALQRSEKPVVASHSNARALCPHPRNLSDEMIRALSEQGGIIGLNLYPYFVRNDGVITTEHLADHLCHMYQVGGEDVLAIGTDFDGFDEGVSDVAHIGQMELVYETVKRKGFTERQMEKIWHGNALRILKEM